MIYEDESKLDIRFILAHYVDQYALYQEKVARHFSRVGVHHSFSRNGSPVAERLAITGAATAKISAGTPWTIKKLLIA